MSSPKLSVSLAAIVSGALIISGIAPYDRATWWMEVAPALIALPLLIITHKRYPLTDLLAFLIALHCLVLIGGGAYTYARVPLGFWMQDWLGTARTPTTRSGISCRVSCRR